MSRSEITPKIKANLREQVTDVIIKSCEDIYGKGSVEPFIAQALEIIPAAMEGSDNYAAAAVAIQQALQATNRLEAILRNALKLIETLEAIRLKRECYSEGWWQHKRQELSQVFQNAPPAGVDRWLQTYADALLAWELAICQRLVQEALPFPQSAAHLPALFQQGTLAIREESYMEALDMLTYLAQVKPANQSPPLLDPISQALLDVLMGRILLYHSTNQGRAFDSIQQARGLAPDNGYTFAVLGDYYRAENDSSQALRFYLQAIEHSQGQPDGFLGMALLAEDQKRWDEAEEWYERAIEAVRDEKDVEVGLSKLLAPVSGNLYLLLARFFAKEEPERALHFVTRALDLGIKADGDYPERIGHQLKGELLEALQKPTEAAEAYYTAGKKFIWENKNQEAAELLARAHELNPSDVHIYWSYSEALRMQSFLPTPPYVDKALIEKSLAVWKQGVKLKLPDTEYSWAHVGRALINDQLARLCDDQRLALQWEAIVYLHRAILLREEDAYRWAYLGRILNTLEKQVTALCATRKALEYGPENLAALDERAAILVNMGDLTAAAEVIGKRLSLKPDIWLSCVKAMVLLFQDQPQEALELLNQKIEKEEDIWSHNLRANCYQMLNSPSLACEDYNWIWERHEIPEFSHIDNQGNFGWSAYHLALLSNRPELFDEAVKIFEKLNKDPIQMVSSDLGIALLTRGKSGDVEEGERCLEEGIEQAINSRVLESTLKFDLPILEHCLNQIPHADLVREVIERVKPKMVARRDQLALMYPHSAEDEVRQAEQELKKVAENPDHQGITDGWALLGAQAELAKLYAWQKRWSEAAGIYQQLMQKESEKFPEARIGLENVINQLQGSGDNLLKEGNTAEALEQFTQAYRFVLESLPEKKREADLLSRIGYAHFDLGNSSNGRENFIKAINLYRDDATSDAGGAFASVCRSLLRNAEGYWALDDGLKALAEELGTDERLRSDLAAARKSLADFLGEFYQLSAQSGASFEMLPVVTPIALEIGQKLIPEDTDSDLPLLKKHFPEMRERIQNEMGVQVPGVRIRRNEGDLPPESYIIMLDEVPLVMGTVRADQRYCPASPETLRGLGIPEDSITEVPHPLTGEPGCWIESEDRDSNASDLERAGLELWGEPTLFMVYHLEALLRRNLADFLGIQEVENLIEQWGGTERGAALAKTVLPDQKSRLRFARLLRALVREMVPIAPWEEIFEVVQRTGLGNDDIGEAMRAVRLQLKKSLPGNNPTAERLALPQEIEQTIKQWVWRDGDKTFFALPPEDTQELLSKIRELVASKRGSLVLVTTDAAIRPFIRRLVELEFPDLMVISQEELIERELTEITSEIQDGVTGNE